MGSDSGAGDLTKSGAKDSSQCENRKSPNSSPTHSILSNHRSSDNRLGRVKDFEDLVRTIVTLCSGEEQERLREMEDWIVKNEGTWVLSEGFNVFLSNVFHRQEWPSDARVAMLRLLAYGAKEDDIVLILHMDRKDHSVMNYAQSFDRLAVKEQESIALLFCSLFETASASGWLMYISEWDAPGA